MNNVRRWHSTSQAIPASWDASASNAGDSSLVPSVLKWLEGSLSPWPYVHSAEDPPPRSSWHREVSLESNLCADLVQRLTDEVEAGTAPRPPQLTQTHAGSVQCQAGSVIPASNHSNSPNALDTGEIRQVVSVGSNFTEGTATDSWAHHKSPHTTPNNSLAGSRYAAFMPKAHYHATAHTRSRSSGQCGPVPTLEAEGEALSCPLVPIAHSYSSPLDPCQEDTPRFNYHHHHLPQHPHPHQHHPQHHLQQQQHLQQRQHHHHQHRNDPQHVLRARMLQHLHQQQPQPRPHGPAPHHTTLPSQSRIAPNSIDTKPAKSKRRSSRAPPGWPSTGSTGTSPGTPTATCTGSGSKPDSRVSLMGAWGREWGPGGRATGTSSPTSSRDALVYLPLPALNSADTSLFSSPWGSAGSGARLFLGRGGQRLEEEALARMREVLGVSEHDSEAACDDLLANFGL